MALEPSSSRPKPRTPISRSYHFLTMAHNLEVFHEVFALSSCPTLILVRRKLTPGFLTVSEKPRLYCDGKVQVGDKQHQDQHLNGVS